MDLIQKLQSELNLECRLICAPHSRVQAEAQARGLQTQTHWQGLRSADFIHVHRRQDLAKVRLKILGLNTPLFYSLYMSAPRKKDLYHAWIYSRVNALVSSSKWVCAEVERNFAILPKNIHCIRYGRNHPPGPWNPKQIEEMRAKYKANSSDLVICSMSRIDPEKGVGDLVEAYLKLPENEQNKLRLWLIGDPTISHTEPSGKDVFEPGSEALEKRLQALNHPRIQRIAFQKDPEAFLQSADLFFLGSTEETYSLAVIDAFLRGKPVLGSHSGGTIEQLQDQDSTRKQTQRGFFFEPRNTESLKEALQQILNLSKIEITEKGTQARTWSLKEHSWENCLQEWKKIYKL